MLFLLLAMLFSAVLAMVLKYLNTSSPYGVFFFNYITCTVLAFAAMEPRTLYNGDFTPCWLGGITGLIYLASLSATVTASIKTAPFSPRCSPGWGCWYPSWCRWPSSGNAPPPCRGWVWRWPWRLPW